MVAFPTETVYGLGARVFDESAIRKVFKVKGRPGDNPLIVHISDMKQLELVAGSVPDRAKRLIKHFWPGPLTLVFHKKKSVPDLVTAGLPTVAVRMPNHAVAKRMIRLLGEPVAAPSANISGRPSATTFESARQELEGKADMILKGEPSRYGLESTVVDCTVSPFRLLRPGSVTLEQLNKIVKVRPMASKAKGAQKSPGLKHKHYQPNCEVLPLSGAEWKKGLIKLIKAGKKIGVLSLKAPVPKDPHIVFSEKFRGRESQYAKKLYSSFYRAEKEHVDVLAVQSTGKTGLGLAIMDRITRAGGKA